MYYILQTITFQLLFLLVYDLFLKKETFFNWNRVYLLGTMILSLLFPFVKLDVFKTTAPEALHMIIPVVELEETVLVTRQEAIPFYMEFTPMQWVLVIGSALSLSLFIYKLSQIFKLILKGRLIRKREYTEVLVSKSNIAFSFFRKIFLGDEIISRDHDHIIEHELVHIRQRHSWDLIFFEVLRILFWFNPLVYIYQKRMAELHEFIADSNMTKSHRKEHYQLLLEEVFHTRKISFINPFFNQSLIKKRIVMLQKSRSKTIWKFKYLLLLPLMLGMLVYTSCEQGVLADTEAVTGMSPEMQTYYKQYREEIENGSSLNKLLESFWFSVNQGDMLSKDNFYRANALYFIGQENYNNQLGLTDPENKEITKYYRSYSDYEDWTATEQGKKALSLNAGRAYFFGGEVIEVVEDENGLAKQAAETIEVIEVVEDESSLDHPFGTISEKPSFLVECEDGVSDFNCFKVNLDKHVMENFKYPLEAQENKIQGRVYIHFRINTDGSVTVINTRAPHPSLEAEGVRIIEALPPFKPGRNENGVPVPVTFAYPIVFKLN